MARLQPCTVPKDGGVLRPVRQPARPFPGTSRFIPGPLPWEDGLDINSTVRLSALCSVCENIRRWMMTQLSDNPIHGEQKVHFTQHTFRHSTTGNDLRRSAENGCHLCTLLCYKLHHLHCQENFLDSADWSQFDMILDIVVMLKYNPFDENYLLLPTTLECVKELRDNFDILALRDSGLIMKPRKDAEQAFPSKSCSIYTASRAIREMAEDWLHECVNSHSHCPFQTKKHAAPTRLVKVIRPESNGINLKLVETRSVAWKGRYAVLSHVWGGQTDLRLSSATVDQMRLGFSSRDLSRTIQDAIRVVRKLGIRYVWVDCLCIMQDSRAEWEDEAERMGDVYQNSYLSIAAIGASSGDQGLFAQRDPLAFTPCWMFRGSDGDEFHAYPHMTEEDFVQTNFEDAALHSRGWVMQERMLAPRTLNFGAMVFWECRSKFRHELALSQTAEDDKRLSLITTPKSIFAALQDLISTDAESLLDFWNSHILIPYSHNHFTVPSDRYYALRGLTQRFAQQTGWDSVFGLWKPFLVDQCLWRVPRYSMRDLQPRIASLPTWSWVSVESLVELPASEFNSTTPVVFRAKSCDVPLYAAEHELGFGSYAGRARIMVASVLLPVHGVQRSIESVHFVDVAGSPGLRQAEFHPDTCSFLPGPHYFLPLIGFGETYALFPHLLGLAVVPVPELEGYYERVGFLSLDLGPGCKGFTAEDLGSEMTEIILV